MGTLRQIRISRAVDTQQSKTTKGKSYAAIDAALHRLEKKVKERQTCYLHLHKTFSEELYKQCLECCLTVASLDEEPVSRACVTVSVINVSKQFIEALHTIRAHGSEGAISTICEKFLQETERFHYHCPKGPDTLDADSYMAFIEKMVSARMPITEEIENLLIDLHLSFICQVLWSLIMLYRKFILPNCKKKSWLIYQYEKVTLLILWKCGDVERNPGPVISDVTRDFCKKMISLLVIQYWERKQGRKLDRADYKTKPDGWPDDIWYGDPSTKECNNETRNIMLNTIRTTCINNAVAVPNKWMVLIEKYQTMQERLGSKQNKEDYANELKSWLCRQRFIETIDQMFERLPEIDTQESDEVLEHFDERRKQYYSQCLQSRKIHPDSIKMEYETKSTMSPNFAIDEVATVARSTINVNDFDLLAGDKVLDRDGTPETPVVKVTPGGDSQKTANEDFVTENNALSTVQPDNFTSFVDLLGDNTVYPAASNTAVPPLPYSYESNCESGTISDDIGLCIKRKLDAREINNDTDVATKRYKTADFEDVFPFANNGGVSPFGEIFPNTKENGIQSGLAAEATLDTREVGHETEIATKRYNTLYSKDSQSVFSFANDGGVSDFGDTFQNTEENGILFGFAAEATLTDLMKLIEPELQGIDTIPDHSSVVKADEVQGNNFNDSTCTLDELAEYLSDEFILEHSFIT